MARQKRPFDAVQFTRESAERIASVVRTAELSAPAASPLTFEPFLEGRVPKQVRAATFSGAWPIGSSKSVTFTNLPTATASVQNISWPITESGYSNEPCVVGKDGTSWYLIVPRLQTATSVVVTSTRQIRFVSATQSQSVVTGVDVSGTISGGVPINVYTTSYTAACSSIYDVELSAELNTSDCSITVSKTLSTSACSYLSSVDIYAEAETGYLTVSVARTLHTAAIAVCAATETAVAVSATATASFLRIRVP